MSLLATITWDDDANFTITSFINSYYLCVCLSSYGIQCFYKSNVLIAPHFHLIVALCLYLFTYCFHMTKLYLPCKGTTFPSLLIIFE